MKVSINENKEIEVTKVYNSITLKTDAGETMIICMRDSGFEFSYEGFAYAAKEGKITKVKQLKI